MLSCCTVCLDIKNTRRLTLSSYEGVTYPVLCCSVKVSRRRVRHLRAVSTWWRSGEWSTRLSSAAMATPRWLCWKPTLAIVSDSYRFSLEFKIYHACDWAKFIFIQHVPIIFVGWTIWQNGWDSASDLFQHSECPLGNISFWFSGN